MATVRRDIYQVTLPADGTPVTVLVFNTSTLQYAQIQASDHVDLVSTTSGGVWRIHKGQVYSFNGAEYRGNAVGCPDKLVMKAAGSSAVIVSVVKVEAV